MKLPILCLDFDGVLHSYRSGWKGAGVVADGPVDGAIAFLHEAVKHFEVCVYSSRSKEPEGVEAMRSALARWEQDYFTKLSFDARGKPGGAFGRRPDRFRPASVLGALTFPTQKPAAFLTLDDRAICFQGIFPRPGDLRNFKTWVEKATAAARG